ncbi:MAG: 2-phospho-L-lactate transferase CofD family protein, partial [Coriobacteriales bacterium]|nr:2-phospho-L-lactate transferase CofD family protein [Coriobacteriales bacterium]
MTKDTSKLHNNHKIGFGRGLKKSKVNAVIIGGGTGASISIKAALALDYKTSAIVSMADDGGSTGVLREKMDILPPGDVRKCIVAMAQDEDSIFCKMLKIRFPELENHSLGNFILSGL